MGFGDLVSRMNRNNQFERVCIDQEVINSIIFYAKKSYPNEFLAMFDGYVKDKVLYISGLVFLPGERSHTSATFNDWLIPPGQKTWGSVHSHPGSNANPSHADLITFSKHGPFHIIVCEPYSLSTMNAYDAYGDPTSFEVADFLDHEDDVIYEDLELLKEEIDDEEEIRPSFFDLDKDLSYFDSDEEKHNKYSDEIFGSQDNISSSQNGRPPSANDFSSNTSFSYSDEDLGAVDLNPQVIRINGERVNGQSPNLGIVIEIRDGKPILKSFTNKNREKDDYLNDDEF